MVSDKTGPMISLFGYILVIIFSFVFWGFSDDVYEILRFVFMLGVGAVGIIGGYLFIKENKYGNYILIIGAIIATIGVFIPIGEITLYLTYIIELFLLWLGPGLFLLNRIIVNIRAEKALELATSIADRNKIKHVMFTYIRDNKGKAFTSKAVYKRCIEDAYSEISLSETEKMLYELNTIGKVQINSKDEVYYYFIA